MQIILLVELHEVAMSFILLLFFFLLLIRNILHLCLIITQEHAVIKKKKVEKHYRLFFTLVPHIICIVISITSQNDLNCYFNLHVLRLSSVLAFSMILIPSDYLRCSFSHISLPLALRTCLPLLLFSVSLSYNGNFLISVILLGRIDD